ncbi:hypothetical protein C0J52_06253 [Blattella germanica]|nr:hypothetical protein C0J52_06253 [Blattella germanica]
MAVVAKRLCKRPATYSPMFRRTRVSNTRSEVCRPTMLLISKKITTPEGRGGSGLPWASSSAKENMINISESRDVEVLDILARPVAMVQRMPPPPRGARGWLEGNFTLLQDVGNLRREGGGKPWSGRLNWPKKPLEYNREELPIPFSPINVRYRPWGRDCLSGPRCPAFPQYRCKGIIKLYPKKDGVIVKYESHVRIKTTSVQAAGCHILVQCSRRNNNLIGLTTFQALSKKILRYFELWGTLLSREAPHFVAASGVACHGAVGPNLSSLHYSRPTQHLMETWYSTREMADMMFCYGQANGSNLGARNLYAAKYPHRRRPSVKMFSTLFQRLSDTGSFAPRTQDRGRPGFSSTQLPVTPKASVHTPTLYNSSTTSEEASKAVRHVRSTTTSMVQYPRDPKPGDRWKENKMTFELGRCGVSKDALPTSIRNTNVLGYHDNAMGGIRKKQAMVSFHVFVRTEKHVQVAGTELELLHMTEGVGGWLGVGIREAFSHAAAVVVVTKTHRPFPPPRGLARCSGRNDYPTRQRLLETYEARFHCARISQEPNGRAIICTFAVSASTKCTLLLVCNNIGYYARLLFSVSDFFVKKEKRINMVDSGTHPPPLVPTPPWSPDLALPDAGACGGACARDSRAFEQLVPILLTDETACQQTVAVPGHELGPALGAGETLEVKHVMTASAAAAGGLLLGCSLRAPWSWSASGPHYEFARGDGLSARRAGSRVAEQPATVPKAILFSGEFGAMPPEM